MADAYLLVDDAGSIVSAVVWDGDTNNWQPPAGMSAVRYDGPWRGGWRWDGTKAFDPNPPPPPPEPTTEPPQASGMTVV